MGESVEAIRRYDILAKLFTFETTAEDILDILKNIDSKNSSKNISKAECENFEIKRINNMSVAELICLPGINMGKAYKIHKYLQKNTFKNKEELFRFAQISQIDKDDINLYNFHKFD